MTCQLSKPTSIFRPMCWLKKSNYLGWPDGKIVYTNFSVQCSFGMSAIMSCRVKLDGTTDGKGLVPSNWTTMFISEGWFYYKSYVLDFSFIDTIICISQWPFNLLNFPKSNNCANNSLVSTIALIHQVLQKNYKYRDNKMFKRIMKTQQKHATNLMQIAWSVIKETQKSMPTSIPISNFHQNHVDLISMFDPPIFIENNNNNNNVWPPFNLLEP